jgi:ribA/ribD-fused uncharacterized protein
MGKHTFFYGGPFSQWYPSMFEVDGISYCTAEQYMMAEKARLFEDYDAAARILATTLPHEQKAIGRRVQNFDLAKWNAVARDIVYRGNYAKFTQNEVLKEELLATVGTLLVEGSPTDQLWGVGLGCYDKDIQNPKNWRGTNWLGEVLTKVREDILAGVVTTENFNWNPAEHRYDSPPPV